MSKSRGSVAVQARHLNGLFRAKQPVDGFARFYTAILSDEAVVQFGFGVFACLSRLHYVIAICAGLFGVAACASVPKVAEPTTPPPGAAAMPEIVGARGPLTAAQSKAVLARLTSEPGDA